MTLSQLEVLGHHKHHDIVPPDPDDVATICYTSGTTGNPKGAVLTNKNFCAAISAIEVIGDFHVVKEDVHISYLPLAHIFERILQTCFYQKGCAVGFYTGDVENLLSDISVLKPTIFPSVPRLFNRIYDKVMQGVRYIIIVYKNSPGTIVY